MSFLPSNGKLEHETVMHESATNLSAMKVALAKPGEHGNDLSLSSKVAAKPRSRQSGNAGKRRRKPRWVASSAKESARALKER